MGETHTHTQNRPTTMSIVLEIIWFVKHDAIISHNNWKWKTTSTATTIHKAMHIVLIQFQLILSHNVFVYCIYYCTEMQIGMVVCPIRQSPRSHLLHGYFVHEFCFVELNTILKMPSMCHRGSQIAICHSFVQMQFNRNKTMSHSIKLLQFNFLAVNFTLNLPSAVDFCL